MRHLRKRRARLPARAKRRRAGSTRSARARSFARRISPAATSAMADRDCATDTQKCVQPGGVCAEPEDIVNGRLRLSSGMSMDAGDGAMGDASMSMVDGRLAGRRDVGDAAWRRFRREPRPAPRAMARPTALPATAAAPPRTTKTTPAMSRKRTTRASRPCRCRSTATSTSRAATRTGSGSTRPMTARRTYSRSSWPSTQSTRVYIDAFAGDDDSMIGSVLQEDSTTGTTFISAGPNARTHIRFRSNRAGRVDFTWTMTTEIDDYEPNNDRDNASPIELDTRDRGATDPALRVQHGQRSLGLVFGGASARNADLRDAARPEGRWAVGRPDEPQQRNRPHRPAHARRDRSFTANIPTAGTYRLQVTNHSNSQITAFTHGEKPEHLSESYAFRVTLAP